MALAFQSPHLSSLIHPELLGITHDLRAVTLFRERHATPSQSTLSESPTFSPLLGEYFVALDHTLQHALLSFPFIHPTTSSDKNYSEPLRLALLTFIHAQLAIHPPSSALMRSLTSQLKGSLEFTPELHALWSSSHATNTKAPNTRATELLISILFIGAHISAGQVERGWFVRLIAQSARVIGVKTWEGMKEVVASFFYVERV
jgi:hypothetical protein